MSDVVIRLSLLDDEAAARLAVLVAVAQGVAGDGERGRFVLDDEEIVFEIGDRRLVLTDTEALVAAGDIGAERLVIALNADPALLITLADETGLLPLSALGPDF